MRIHCPDDILSRLHQLSDGRYELVASPDDADVILVIFPWIDGEQVEKHDLVDRFPDRCFAISTTAYPQYKAHGISTTASGFVSRFGGRIRTGGYTTNTSLFKNPFIEAELPGAGIDYPKQHFFSFIGRNCHPVRRALFEIKYSRSDILIEDSSNHFALWDEDRNEEKLASAQRRFCNELKKSKFALCPRGISPNSIRLFEALKLGVAPVILSDDWTFPLGPRWGEFSIVVPEKHAGELERILGEYEDDYKSMGKQAAYAYENWFSEEAYFNFLVESCLDIQRTQWIPERLAQSLLKTSYRVHATIAQARKRLGIRTRLKRVFRVSGP